LSCPRRRASSKTDLRDRAPQGLLDRPVKPGDDEEEAAESFSFHLRRRVGEGEANGARAAGAFGAIERRDVLDL
jgi:hypothetical protein